MELGRRRGHTYRSYPLQGVKIIKRMLNTDCEIVTRFDVYPQTPFLQTLASLRLCVIFPAFTTNFDPTLDTVPPPRDDPR